MTQNSCNTKASLIGMAVGGIVVGLAIASPALAQTNPTSPSPSSLQNPCPSIFYEEPFNSQVPAPAGCPANAVGNRPMVDPTAQTQTAPAQITPAQVPPTMQTTPSQMPPMRTDSPTQTVPPMQTDPTQTAPTQMPPQTSTPAPEEQQSPVATTTLNQGMINVKVVNTTNTPVTYQVIGDTNQRMLPAQSEANLLSLRAPTTITFIREDGGLLSISPSVESDMEMMEVTLDETTSLDVSQKSLVIEKNGNVFVN